MRAILHGDITSAARALLPVPQGARRARCRRLIKEAEFADRYTRRFGKIHPLWGNGSLMGAARKYPLAREPRLGDLEYCSCMEMVLHELIQWRRSIQNTIS